MKKHACSHPGCSKAFTRAEHLRRHSLNHDTESGSTGYTCQRCLTHFSRPDLLTRHMTRHEKKDAEAGGAGKGVLETRKRMRRAEDGRIVVRPPKRQNRQKQSQFPCQSSTSGSASASVSVSGVSDHPGAPVSPPGSAGGEHALSIDEDLDSDPLLAPMMPGGPFEPYVEPIPGQFDAADGSWGEFEGNSLMDTATDFNLPFAATGNYNWLFDVASLDDAFTHLELPLGPDLVPFTDPIEQDPMLNLDLDIDFNGLPTFDQEDGSSVLLQAASFVERNPRRDPDMDWMTGSTSIEPVPLQPQINDDARRGILALIAQSPPVDIHGQPLNLDSPLLSLSALQNYSNLFFSRFNTVYPLIHTATFDANTIEPVFLAAILSMGATYCSREAHQLAVGIHDSLRNRLFCNEAFSPSPELWVLQAMLLIDCFGKMRAGPKQRERAQLFHCVLIKLIRRSTCCSIRSSHTPAGVSGAELEKAWREAMQDEQRKRLAFQCFMWDTEHAVLFSQSLCMSAFEIRSSLPCSSAAWDAHTPEEWSRHASKETEHAFLPVLKGYVTPNSTSRPRNLPGLSRLVVLHGLMSISADLKRRDQTTLRSETPERVGAWTPRMSRAYDLWKADLDADCLNMKLSSPSPIDEARRFTALKASAMALYRAASLALHVEVLDLQIAAGAAQILGRAVSERDFVRSRRGLSAWMTGTGCSSAARHAALLLQDAVLSLHDWDQTDAFHFPWCLYLATLTVWAFHSAGAEKDMRHKPTDLSSLIVAMTTSSPDELVNLAGGYDTRPLVRAMAQQLAVVRWAVVHDAMKVLLGLGSD